MWLERMFFISSLSKGAGEDSGGNGTETEGEKIKIKLYFVQLIAQRNL